ncbi:hypothetical protein AURDEDRAFT_185924 [Auricularia subglabra TFB-10046 SS5]|nr:hypothetical protein AURDEDRAFT_185924 [Auricularia subglabra TFB-10046 SS5]
MISAQVLPNFTLRVPAEVISRIFDELDLRAAYFIRVPGAVCSRWRVLALSHRAFNRDICVDWSNSPDINMALFLAQLHAGIAADVDFDFRVYQPHPLAGRAKSPPLQDFLPHIVAHMHRCASITVIHRSRPDLWRPLLDALCARPAPRLQELCLWLLNGGDDDWGEEAHVAVRHSPDVSCGLAPRLRSLELLGMALKLFPHAGPPIPAFSAVTSLRLVYLYRDPVLFGPLASLTELRMLEIENDAVEPPPAAGDLFATLKLDSALFRCVPASWSANIAALDVASIPELTITLRPTDGEDELSSSLAMFVYPYKRCLQGALDLAIREETSYSQTDWKIVVRAPACSRTLTIQPDIGCFRANQSARLLSLWASRLFVVMRSITSLTICTAHWPVLCSTPTFPLPDVETLALCYDGGPLPSKLACAALPALRKVVLSLCPCAAPEAFRIDADIVALFLHDAIVAGPDRPSLVVQPPLHLVGDRSTLQSLVHSILES